MEGMLDYWAEAGGYNSKPSYMSLERGLFPTSSNNPAVLTPIETIEGIELDPSSPNIRRGHSMDDSNLSSPMPSPRSTSTPASARLSTNLASEMLQTQLPSSSLVYQDTVESRSGCTIHYIAAAADPGVIRDQSPIYQFSQVPRNRLVEIITKAVESSILWNEEGKKHDINTCCISLFSRSSSDTDCGLSFVISKELEEELQQTFNFKPYQYQQETNNHAVSKRRGKPPKKRRGMAPKACMNCHDAKVRCNMATPCQRCIRRTDTCIYQ